MLSPGGNLINSASQGKRKNLSKKRSEDTLSEISSEESDKGDFVFVDHDKQDNETKNDKRKSIFGRITSSIKRKIDRKKTTGSYKKKATGDSMDRGKYKIKIDECCFAKCSL